MNVLRCYSRPPEYYSPTSSVQVAVSEQTSYEAGPESCRDVSERIDPEDLSPAVGFELPRRENRMTPSDPRGSPTGLTADQGTR